MRESNPTPTLVILDFSLVLGLDSSAAQSIAKLKEYIRKHFTVEIIIFVTGHQDGFRCAYDLSHRVVDDPESATIEIVEHRPSVHHHRLSLAAGAVAKQILKFKLGKKYEVIGGVTQLGILGSNPKNWNDKFISNTCFRRWTPAFFHNRIGYW